MQQVLSNKLAEFHCMWNKFFFLMWENSSPPPREEGHGEDLIRKLHPHYQTVYHIQGLFSQIVMIMI